METTELTKSKEEVIDQFILRTYRIWKSGKLEHLVTKSKETSDSMSYSEFIKFINNSIEYSISSILQKTNLLDDEFFISGDNINGKVFILTDRRIFISSQNDLRKGFDIIYLKDIKTIKFKTGWSASGLITLNDGRIFNYTKLDCGINEEFIYKLKSIDHSHFFLNTNDQTNINVIDDKAFKDGSVAESTKSSNSGGFSFILIAIAAGSFFLYTNRDKLDSDGSIIIYVIGGIFLAYQSAKMFR